MRLVKKENLGFDPDKNFVMVDDILDYYRSKGKAGIKKEDNWEDLYARCKEKYPTKAAEYETFSNGKLPERWKDDLPVFKPDAKGIATRKASGKTLNSIVIKLPLLIGGSADPSPSTVQICDR